MIFYSRAKRNRKGGLQVRCFISQYMYTREEDAPHERHNEALSLRIGHLRLHHFSMMKFNPKPSILTSHPRRRNSDEPSGKWSKPFENSPGRIAYSTSIDTEPDDNLGYLNGQFTQTWKMRTYSGTKTRLFSLPNATNKDVCMLLSESSITES
jgi:hypothetical protein